MTLREMQAHLRNESGLNDFATNPGWRNEFSQEFIRLALGRANRTNPLSLITNRIRNPEGRSYNLAWSIPIDKIADRVFSIPDCLEMAAHSLNRFFMHQWFTLVHKARPTQILASEAQVRGAVKRQLRRYGGGVILGSIWALDPLLGEIEENVKESHYRRGVIGTYRGSYVISVGTQYNPFQLGSDIDHRILIVMSSVPGARFGYDILPNTFNTFEVATNTLDICISVRSQVEITNPEAYTLFQVGMP